jgi:hypothetical protein
MASVSALSFSLSVQYTIKIGILTKLDYFHNIVFDKNVLMMMFDEVQIIFHSHKIEKS